MDYKKKLQQRLYVAYAEVAIGVLLIAAAFIFKLDNYFFSSFGLCLAIVVDSVFRVLSAFSVACVVVCFV